MKEVINFISRHFVWLITGLAAIIILKPGIAEIKTVLIIITAECLALSLSGLAAFVFTKIDFTKDNVNNNLGLIFLGVHIFVSIVVLGVYIVQYGS